MNLPNKLTLLRVFLVPVCCGFIMLHSISFHYLIAFLVFVIASVTDTLDGSIARKRNIVTSFGQFMDPLADKVLVVSIMILFVELGFCPAWVVILVVARDFTVSGIRLVAASESGHVIAANIWGKIKTTFQMIAVGAVLLLAEFSEQCWISEKLFLTISLVMMYLVAVLTVISGVVYVIQNIDCIKSFK